MGGKTKDFPLFSKHCGFTDDTVMTIAVAQAFYGVPEPLVRECRSRLKPDLLEVLDRFTANLA